MTVDANGVSPGAEPRWRLDLRVSARSGSLAEVRRSFGSLAIPPEVLDDAKVLVSELVGNSIRHSGLEADEYVQITAEWSGARLRVAVHDRPHRSTPLPVAGTIRPRPGAESGWGLFIVDRLASRWGADKAGYWFEIDGDRTAPS
jgi:anti-sigma regulatory factor (Ser/Thr protein kinase)